MFVLQKVTPVEIVSVTIHRPPAKLREGNVFTGVCLFRGKGVPHVTITHCALDLIAKNAVQNSVFHNKWPLYKQSHYVSIAKMQSRKLKICSHLTSFIKRPVFV